MLIGNIKSQQDLQAKKNLQKELLAVEVANEQLKQKKRQEFRSPNYEPAKLLPQYRTTAELEADRETQEKSARKILEDIGFDYTKVSELIAWIGSSTVNKLAAFNANAKAIKNELLKNYDPKIITVGFVKNFLTQYFSNLETNFGLKITGTIGGLTTLDQLEAVIPSQSQLNQFKNILNEVKDIISVFDIEDLDVDKVSNIVNNLIYIFNLYSTYLPTPALLTKLKVLLNQSERSEFVRNYSSQLKTLGGLSKKEFDEIIGQFKSVNIKYNNEPNFYLGIVRRLADKVIKLLSPISANPTLNFNTTVNDYIKSKDIELTAKFDELGIQDELDLAKNKESIELIDLTDFPFNADEGLPFKLKGLVEQQPNLEQRIAEINNNTKEFLDEVLNTLGLELSIKKNRELTEKEIIVLERSILRKILSERFKLTKYPLKRTNEEMRREIGERQLKFVIDKDNAEIKQYDFINNPQYRYKLNDNENTMTGLGFSDKLKKHFKKDEKELREQKDLDDELAKELKRHEAVEKEIGLGFRAKRIPVKKIGKGVPPPDKEENPTYRSFGKYVIHLPHLINNDTANFKYPSLGSIPTLKPTKVSQDYKDLLIDILNTGKLSEKELKRLPQSEIKHFERVALGAGLVEKFGLKIGSTDEDQADAKRFEVLRGEYLAGNNNEKLIKELRLLIIKFLNNGRIHKSEATNLLIELATI